MDYVNQQTNLMVYVNQQTNQDCETSKCNLMDYVNQQTSVLPVDGLYK